jgi:hypothetical protein
MHIHILLAHPSHPCKISQHNKVKMCTFRSERLSPLDVNVNFHHFLEAKTQCSVCWDDFTLGEEVRKLVCDHFFHENCIVPWLQLHATCPVCRKSQNQTDDQVTKSRQFLMLKRQHLRVLKSLFKGALKFNS